MPLEEVLGICMKCRKIRVSKEKNLWLKREDDVGRYDNLMNAYKGKLTHTYCPEDFKKVMENIEELR